MTQLVGIIGTDGSGKTTLSAALVEALERGGIEARHEWLGAESYLMAPVRGALKLVWRRRRIKSSSLEASSSKGGLSSGYRAEISTKNAVVARFPWAVRLYVFLVLLDYRLQLRRKLRRRDRSAVVVADRYVFDVAVNLGLVLGWSPSEVVRFLQRQLTRVRLPDVRVFLRVEPEVSLARKDDIPDVDYLRLRLSYYDAVARAFGFEVRDGTRPPAETAEWLVNHVRRELEKPHVHYVHSNNVDVGGADKVLVRMAQHMGRPNPLTQAGEFRVSVSLRLATATVGMHEQAGTPVLLRDFERPQVSAGTRGLLRFAVQGPRTYLYFRGLFALQGPDLVHVNDVYDFIPALAARHMGIPVVAHLRMFQRRPSVRLALSKLISRVADASVSVSEAVRRHYFPMIPSGHRSVVIHDLGDAGLMADQGDVLQRGAMPSDVVSDGRLVAMVGRIEEWKGQAVFLDAVQLLPAQVRDAATFALVGGEVPGKETYYREIGARAAETGVLFLGVRNDVPAILRAADVSIHCSTEPDPFPGVVIESLLAGAATVGARDGGVPEMIDGSAAGILTTPGSARELADAIRDLITSPISPRARFGEEARARGLELVDPAPIDDAVTQLYFTVLSSRGAST
jgi:glycosyltransferase involved in cell wall biosynthesis